MISINDNELFERYYQKEYDFNTTSLKSDDIEAIKELAKEKRVDYALAPIGEKIFELIPRQNPNLRFETVDLVSDKIDGMLYIPEKGEDKAYIILNSKKPFINQIFASAHEYYHYIKDYTHIKKKPYICSFQALRDTNEKRASRFAAEFLLPEEALRNDVRWFRKKENKLPEEGLNFEEYAVLSIVLTLKYQMPLKAVIYRLYEEHYIKDIRQFIEKYEVIKCVLQELEYFKEKVDYLYSPNNQYLASENIIYRRMKNAYETGYASRDEIIKDAETLKLDMHIIDDFFEKIVEDENAEDDKELIEEAAIYWGKIG